MKGNRVLIVHPYLVEVTPGSGRTVIPGVDKLVAKMARESTLVIIPDQDTALRLSNISPNLVHKLSWMRDYSGLARTPLPTTLVDEIQMAVWILEKIQNLSPEVVVVSSETNWRGVRSKYASLGVACGVMPVPINQEGTSGGSA